MPTDSGGEARSGAILTVDLAAIQANYRTLKARMAAAGETADCAAVVKADAYGLGIEAVAPALWAAGARSFFVAQLDEGLALRRVLPEASISILNGLMAGAVGEYLAANLRPVLNTPAEIDAWLALAEESPALPPAALHLDSGMNRLGLSAAEAEAFLARPASERPPLDLVMSHLACAEDPADPLNAAQQKRFAALAARLPGLAASFANSSGLFLGPDYLFDLGRPGVALYGVNPTPRQANPMRPVVELKAKVLQVRDLDLGDCVGYGASYRVSRPGRSATLAVGYADGFLRSLSGRGSALYEGRRLPLIGRVSMDLVAVDVTDVPGPGPERGDLVTLIGPGHDVDALAAEAGTIGYEVLTALGKRYHRVYLPASPESPA